MRLRLGAVEFWPSSPQVMLSPNARKDVVASFGGLSTETRNEQVSARWSASVAVHETVRCPIENIDPETGEQMVLTGAWPLATVGAVKMNDRALPSVD